MPVPLDTVAYTPKPSPFSFPRLKDFLPFSLMPSVKTYSMETNLYLKMQGLRRHANTQRKTAFQNTESETLAV